MRYPPDFTVPGQKHIAASLAAESIAGLSRDRKVVVQAGGCAGLWPMALADHFDEVYTFEPEPTNFQYLRANVASRPNVYAYDYALSDTRGRTGLTRPKAQAGLWRMEGDGEIPVVTLDEFCGDLVIDALVLDVEGHEVPALKGAEQLITRHRPLLWFEYLQHTSEIDAFLEAHDYTSPAYGMGIDRYSVHTAHVQ